MLDVATISDDSARRADELPDGFGVAWDSDAIRLDDGHVVVGGVPRRLIRLSDGARRSLERLTSPQPVAVSSAMSACIVRPLLDAGLLPLYTVAESNASSRRLARRLGFQDSGAREFECLGQLRE